MFATPKPHLFSYFYEKFHPYVLVNLVSLKLHGLIKLIVFFFILKPKVLGFNFRKDDQGYMSGWSSSEASSGPELFVAANSLNPPLQ